MKGRHLGKKILVIASFFLLIAASAYGGFSLLVSAEDAAVIPVPDKDGVSELGTRNNPLFILEIVPNRSYGEVGYWISGCEPVDMEQLSISNLASEYQAGGFAVCTTTTENKYVFEIDPEELASGKGNWTKSGEERGYYQKVTDETGTISQKQAGSEFIYTYEGAGKGQYKWIQNDDTTMPTDHTADQVWMTIDRYTRNKMIFTHKNTFLKEAVGVPEEKLADYQSVVITVDPTDLANPDNLDLIKKADVIYINGKAPAVAGLPEIWKKFNKEGGELTNTSTNFQGSNDFTWETTMAIFDRTVSKNRAVIMMDATNSYLSPASENNAHKLCIMLLQMGPANFNRLYIKPGKIKTKQVGGKTVAYYVGAAGNQTVTAWNKDTFLSNNGGLELKNPDIIINNTTAGEGVYTFSGSLSLWEYLGTKTITETGVTRDAFDWYEHYDRYVKEDRDVNSARRSSISPAEAIFSMLDQEFHWADKNELNILEIQPYDDFIYGTGGWEVRYRKLFPYFMGAAGDIHVTTMTTYDFIGKIEDINARYDMIIIGLNTGSKNINQYSDANLNGKVYLSIGDKVYKETGTAKEGIRYSGNDITQKKLEELKDFMLSGRPVVLTGGRSDNADNFYTDTTRKKVSLKVDKATYLYRLADVIRQEGLNVYTPEQEQIQEVYRSNFRDKIFYEKQFNSYLLQEKISNSVCSLEFANKSNSGMYPVPYSYSLKGDGSIEEAFYNDSNTLKYRFKILGSGASYAVKLYIDNNGDGRYNGSIDTPTGAKQEGISNLKVKDDSNKSVAVNALKPNTWYTLTRHLDDTYQGIIPWKLEVNQTDNTSLRCSEINYTVIKKREEAKVEIKVLQVAIDAGTGNVSNSLNMQTDDRFQRYLQSVAEYKVNITCMTNQQFLAKFTVGHYDDFLEDYDMLILGFRDCCSYTNNPAAHQEIKDFINQGKSIIFSHDVIWDKDAGTERHYNAELRKILSQDRYNFDVGKKNSDQKEQSIYYNDTSNTMQRIPMQIYASGINYSDSSYDKYWKFYTDNSNKLVWSSDPADTNNSQKVYKDRNSTNYTTGWETTRISVANKGQITQYPFLIGDTIQVATTHFQYYQLDLEQEDMVVWYNLSDNQSKLMGGTNNGFYSSRENDSRNNYYIYNKGNITYTGLGHRNNLTNDEIKLFINTMISSYRAGFAQPRIVVTNEDVYTAGTGEQFLFISSDTDSVDVQDASVVKTVRFRVEEDSVVNTSDRKYYVSYHAWIPDPADSTKTIRVEMNPTAAEASTDVLATKNLNTGTVCSVTAGKGTNLNSDDEFSIQVPLKYFQGRSQLVVEMELMCNEIDEDGNEIALKSISKLNIVANLLFDLD